MVARFIDATALLQSLNLPPWPDDGSESAQSDLAGVLAAQAARTAADAADALVDATRSPVAWAQDAKALGPGFTAQCYPLASALLVALHNDMRLVNRAANQHRGIRNRPALVDARVVPSLPVDNVNRASYPSARAASSRVWALLLADIFPQRRDALISQAERSASLRLLAGVHFPSDIAAGRLVGSAAYAWLKTNGHFREALEMAKRDSASPAPCRPPIPP